MSDSPLPQLQPMPTDWQRALAVVAHPDDLEFGCSAAIAAWVQDGREITYVLATRGEAGIDTLAPAEAGPLREKEQRASAAAVGVGAVEFLDHQDGVVQYGIPLRRDIAAAIRRHRPELVITLNHRATCGSPSPIPLNPPTPCARTGVLSRRCGRCCGIARTSRHSPTRIPRRTRAVS